MEFTPAAFQQVRPASPFQVQQFLSHKIIAKILIKFKLGVQHLKPRPVKTPPGRGKPHRAGVNTIGEGKRSIFDDFGMIFRTILPRKSKNLPRTKARIQELAEDKAEKKIRTNAFR